MFFICQAFHLILSTFNSHTPPLSHENIRDSEGDHSRPSGSTGGQECGQLPHQPGPPGGGHHRRVVGGPRWRPPDAAALPAATAQGWCPPLRLTDISPWCFPD